ncbi:MAG: ATP-binding cassette domain-containing protein [Proteobacteria bacterium]|nr:ATP-binding cassette domain-containing protein [Pseudomonadota bacterium]
MLEISNLGFGYSAKAPLIDVRKLRLNNSQHLLVQGPSGSGKSSLLFLLAGLLQPQKGRIYLGETEMTALPAAARDAYRGRNIGFVFQQPHLMAPLTVLQNVLVAPFMAGLAVEQAHALALLEKLGLGKLAQRRPHELSLGQQQRVGVARALVHKPQLVLADEPTSALDDEAAEAVIGLLLETAESVGAQVVAASHDARIKKHFSQTLSLKGE